MSVCQRSCVSVRPCGLAFSNVCFRPCPFICLVASSFLSAKEYTNPPVCIVSPLRGSIWLRSGSLWRFSAPSRCVFTPYLCPQAAGQRSRCAHRTSAPFFFWAAEGYRATDTFMGCYNRFIPQSVPDGFLCPQRHSKVSFELLKGFSVTPGNAPCPLRGRASSPKSGSLFPTCGMRAGSCACAVKQTTKSIIKMNRKKNGDETSLKWGRHPKESRK